MNSLHDQACVVAEVVERQHLYFPAGDTQLSGWYHTSRTPHRDCVALVCPPVGYEYTHSHRSLRHLCDDLARAGIPALRFDYHGSGDSPGNELEDERIRRWQGDIVSAIHFAKAHSGCNQCCIIGVRLGGMLAALAAQHADVDFLVFWNTPISGKRYVRELTAVAAAAATQLPTSSDLIESGGFLISRQTAESLKNIDLLDCNIPIRRAALVVDRDDVPATPDLCHALRKAGVHTEQRTLPGYADMMAEPQFTAVPDAAIQQIIAWLCEHTNPIKHLHDDATQHSPQHPHESSVIFNNEGQQLREIACHFGEHKHLFGILTTTDLQPQTRPTIVMLNSGTVHHVGPGRLYVTLARILAHKGFNCFRVDIEGIGDSVLRHGDRENHPYPDNATADAVAALNFLQTQWGVSEFVLLGLCSGAYTAFHTGVQNADFCIRHIISINPLTFRWIEGMTLLTTQHFQDIEYYKGSMRNPKSWTKLLRGKVDLLNLVKIAGKQVNLKMRAYSRSLRERLTHEPSTQLGQELKTLLNRGRSLSFFISSGDPGYNLLVHSGGHYAEQLVKTGKISATFIEKADHTFSRLTARKQLIQAILSDLARKFPT